MIRSPVRRATTPGTSRPGRRWRTAAVLVLAVAAVAALVWLVGFSSVLAVREATVEGTSYLTETEVRDAAQVPIGVSLARVNTSDIEERVSELLPVREVRVRRAWPHAIRIEVRERTTVFVAQQAETLWAVDEMGVGFFELDEVPEDALLADEVAEAEWEGVAVVASALPAEAAKRAERITTRGPDAIVIHLSDEVLVEWGSAEQSEQKASVLAALLKAVPEAEVYNVSAPHHPTTSGGPT